MSYQISKTGEIRFSGFEQGIGVSPHKGIANMQGVNIYTETGEAMCSFSRTLQSQANISATGTIAPQTSSTLVPTIAGGPIRAGIWITIGTSTITNLTASQTYYVSDSESGFIQLSTAYGVVAISTFGLTGAATFTIASNFGQPLAYATEKYSDGTSFLYRYYVLDSNGYVWVQDTGVTFGGVTFWFLPELTAYAGSTGIAVLNGWVMLFTGNIIYCKPTVKLGVSFLEFFTNGSGRMMSLPGSSQNIHYALPTREGILYYTDGTFVGSIFPNVNLLNPSAPNIQSYCKWTGSGGAGTINILIGGSVPNATTSANTIVRIPAVFFATPGGSIPSSLTADTVYYIAYAASSSTFTVYAAATGGVAIADLATGASGTQYFNTFYPTNAAAVAFASSGPAAVTFTPQQVNLPFYETAQCLAELGTQIIIGGRTNTIYPYSNLIGQITASDFITLPENNIVNMVTVNNMVYILAGNKGNIYITNGSAASVATSVPDYCAGIAGTPSSYIEPYFTWGGLMYVRGRVYFSIQDQTASKAGNCGGVWSFTPTENLYIGQDTGIGLRLENQASYGTYSGMSNLLIPSQVQTAKSPQYWNCWTSSISSPAYGIDFTNTTTSTSAIIETELVPTGTVLDKKTFSQVEYKLASPLAVGESVAISYRKNGTESFTSCGTAKVESATALSGYFSANFEKTQWIQLKIVLNPLSNSSTSFVRLEEVIIR